MEFTALLRERFSRLTPSQQMIARYIERNKDRVAFMTARQLAAVMNISDAAIVRFSRAVGYEGYAHMKESLGDALIERTGASGILHREPALPSETELKESVFANASQLLKATAELNEDRIVSAVAGRIAAARRIWVSGNGTSFSMVSYLAMQLNHFLGNTEVFNIGHGDVADRILQVNEQDVFIGIGWERYIPYTIDLMSLARQRGAYVVAMTDRASSPLANEADEMLYIVRSSSAVAWWSKVSPMIVADWLMAQVITKDEEKIKANLKLSDDAWRLLGHWKNANTRELFNNNK
ncbi:MurR/RpiR family transcriptional regulator [Symbiopectobacterium purcellii]|uniref:MurR/RpiR family transcriptional regulator n=1 Tax=Symbiopectobacterium purcellii TaxID=2871826 RepID=A0ABX9APV5_9ENTR|nr:MurR/RpiR family transcriptional regulator [Symbiopectobacterium purcellii]QZN97088.1 MurR/RpiR family transcriptional regulator [Symbiopectobacterium purcellii]